MKRIANKIICSISAAFLLLLASCSKKIDEAFANPNAQVRQPIETILPGVIANMVNQFSANGTRYGPQNDGQYIGRFIQNWATNTSLNQYDQMGDNFINSSDIMGSIWAMHYYGHGQNVEKIIEWGTEEKKWDYVGVAQAIRAWGWLTLTDLHADAIILKEAFRPEQLVFKYDTQEEVYEEVKRLCRLAIENLSKTGDGVSQANLIKGDQYMNGGDVNKWKKFVYGIMARTFHRITNKATYQADSVIFYCNLAMQTNADNTSLKWSNGGGIGTYSYWSPFGGGAPAASHIGNTLRQTKFIADLMRGVNAQFPTVSIDPRAPYIIRENPNGTYRGIIPNKGGGSAGLILGDSSHNFWGGAFQSTTNPASDANCRYVFTNSPVFPVITASEIQFIKAEALLRKGDRPNALTSYVNGINLNYDQLIADYQINVPSARRITLASREAHLTNPLVIPSSANLTLSHIMMQKYIAMYAWGVVETWVDMRRYHYTDLDPVTGLQVYRDFTPPSGTDLYSRNSGKLIYRHRPRYNSEYLYNIDELNRVGAFALDYITKEHWFSQP